MPLSQPSSGQQRVNKKNINSLKISISFECSPFPYKAPAQAVMNESSSNKFTKSLYPGLCGGGERDAGALECWGHPCEEFEGRETKGSLGIV